MKIKLTLYAILFCLPLKVLTQVGINTTTPQGLLHIDPLNNTIGSTNVSDDIIVTTNGDVGIGTINPAAKLHIVGKSSLRIADGTQAAGHVFTAVDNTGLGKWANPNVSSRVTTCHIDMQSMPYNLGVEGIFNGDLRLITNDLGFSISGYTFTAPKGKYIVTINHDVLGVEYGIFRIRDNADKRIIYEKAYSEWLVGVVTYVELPKTTSFYVSFTPTFVGGAYSINGIVGAGSFSTLSFLSLQ